MKFNEFEELMLSYGAMSLADIARKLNTTPQAVSNWKARDQIPFHVVSKLNQIESQLRFNQLQVQDNSSFKIEPLVEEPTFFDLFVTISKNIKIILLAPLISAFLTFTYIQFVQKDYYLSEGTLVLPVDKESNTSGLAGLASQFGINIGGSSSALDLSSPSLFPELIKSRLFIERVLKKKFFSNQYNKELTLLAILTHGDQPTVVGEQKLLSSAIADFSKMVSFSIDPMSLFSSITVESTDPMLSKDLADQIIIELEKLNRFFKNQTVVEKIAFIELRIASVEEDLELSEQSLKLFNEQNRQISTPSLLLEQERLQRDVEVQKNIYMTLKQQLELSKIEEVQKSSIIQILDPPNTPIYAISKSLKLKVILSIFVGLGLGMCLALVRQFYDGANIYDQKKLFKGKSFLKKYFVELFTDYKVSGFLFFLLLFGSPFYLGHQSESPIYFGLYSRKAFLVVISYVLVLTTLLLLTVFNLKREKE